MNYWIFCNILSLIDIISDEVAPERAAIIHLELIFNKTWRLQACPDLSRCDGSADQRLYMTLCIICQKTMLCTS